MVHSIWVPDTFFPNEKKSFFHEATTHNSFLRINHHGNVTRSMRLTVTANCPMNLEYFPLDSQNCSLEIESYGYSSRDIRYTWREAERSSPPRLASTSRSSASARSSFVRGASTSQLATTLASLPTSTSSEP